VLIGEVLITVFGAYFRAMMDLTGGIGMSAVIVACPSPEAQRGTFKLAATGGYINFFGELSRGSHQVTLDANDIH